MKLNTYEAPHIRYKESTRGLMSDALVTMLFIYFMALYYYGPRVIMLGLVSVVAAVLSDCVCVLLAGRRVNPRDLSPVVTGMLLPLLMPASVPYYVAAVAAVFAIVVAKQPFGGVGNNVFNPVAAGFCFVAICFTDQLFSYTAPLQHLPVFGVLDITTVNSPAFTLEVGGLPQYDLVDMALGNFPGPMGATNILVIVACLLYLVFRNTISWVTPLCFFATVGVYALLWPRVDSALLADATMRLQLVLYEMMSGMLLLGGVFLLGDPVTTPKRGWSKISFGVVAGLAVMLFRRFGGFEEEFTFAILFMNATVWGFDMLGEQAASFFRRRKKA